MIIFAQPLVGSSVVFAQLDAPFGDFYSQSNPASVTLSDNSTHEFIPVYEHGLTAVFDIYDAGTHEFVDAGGPASYIQSGRVSVTLFDSGAHEYVPVVVIFSHSGTNTVTFSASGTHVYFPGADPGDYIHDELMLVTFSANGNHGYTPSQSVVEHIVALADIAAWLSTAPTEVELDFSDDISSLRLMSFQFTSLDDNWQTQTGPFGGNIAAAIELVRTNDTLPIVSVSKSRPEATILELEANQALFDALETAMATGPVKLRIGGYEALADRSLPLPLFGSATLTVQAQV